jgi:phosphotransferase system enzyme I (PtsI)
MNRKDLPGEEEQFREYKKVAEVLDPDPVIIRTMDLGGDKPAESITIENEKNPALGLRAIRVSLREVDVFKVQLRAILRASCHGNIKVMFPMISGVDELRKAKDILFECQKELEEENTPFNKDIPIGIMIEVPSSTNIADLLAREVDFFSIGTNDLIQYALAVDRGNQNVAYLYKPLHPAILRMIQNTVQAANNADIEVGICGEMGGNIINTMALLGLGKINEISMDSHSIPKVKKMIRSITIKEARKFAKEITAIGSTDEIERIVRQKMLKKFPEDFAEESVGVQMN